MRVVVTGAEGFVGRYLADYLKEYHDVTATGIIESPPAWMNLPYIKMDITDITSIRAALIKAVPDAVIHLAAQSMVGLAWSDPANTVNTNTIGTINLVNVLIDLLPNACLLAIGSSEEYGLSGKKGESLTEESPCEPQNPYATSKLAMGQIALQMAKRHNLKILHLRPFNHFGPGQQRGFVVSDFASQVAEIEQNKREPVIKVGNLKASRDFTDVRDVIRAYALLLDKAPDTGIYNICSGIACSAEKILDTLLTFATVPIKVEQDPAKIRPSEVPLFVGSNTKLINATGWYPKHDFNSSLLDTLNWWREKIKAT